MSWLFQPLPSVSTPPASATVAFTGTATLAIQATITPSLRRRAPFREHLWLHDTDGEQIGCIT